MTIETNLDRIATALEVIVKNLTAPTHVQQSAPVPVPVPVPIPQAPVPQFQAPQSPSQFQAPQPQAQSQAQAQGQYPKSPLTDGNSVMAYCVEKYRALGPVKGAEIQTVLSALGHSNVATLRVDQYDEFFFKVEGL